MRAPHLSEIRYHMVFAMQRNGESDGACQELSMLINTDKEFESYKDARSLANKPALIGTVRVQSVVSDRCVDRVA